MSYLLNMFNAPKFRIQPKRNLDTYSDQKNNEEPELKEVNGIKLVLVYGNSLNVERLDCGMCTENHGCDRKTYCLPSIELRKKIEPNNTSTKPGNFRDECFPQHQDDLFEILRKFNGWTK